MLLNIFKSYKQTAETNKAKVIKRDVKSFKKLCLKEFKQNINRGIDTTVTDFCLNVSHEFEEEISEIVLTELRQENKGIEFSFSWRHFANSYKGIKMVAI